MLTNVHAFSRLDKKPLMPYSVWEERLRIRVRTWYKVLTENKGNIGKVRQLEWADSVHSNGLVQDCGTCISNAADAL